MEYQEIIQNARNYIGPYCKSCPVCNGRACGNKIPGPGAKGTGTVFMRNYEKWQEIKINMDTFHDIGTADTSFRLFGETFALPVLAAPIGSLKLHYGELYDDVAYDNLIIPAALEAGIAALVGDGPDPGVMEGAAEVLKHYKGKGIPTIKPWDMDTVRKKIELVKPTGPYAIAMDIDAAGLPFLKNQNPPAGSKTVDQLKQIAEWAEIPFMVKGIMTPKAALHAVEAGADAIVVSNHGGRVLDGCPATAEVLSPICEAVKGRVKVLVDGGIRTGVDIFRALALGADGVLIGRPFVNMLYGGGAEGVRTYVKKLKSELEDTMLMCGAGKLAEINGDMIKKIT